MTKKKLKYYLPIIGIFLFIVFYVFSTFLYPGGSRIDPNFSGFDWLNNYWCTMFDEIAINGQPNQARPFAILSMITLWISLLIFFFMFSNVFLPNTLWGNAIKISSTISIIFASLLFTKLHDFVTTASSLFGVVSIIGLLVGIVKSNLVHYKITGILCIILLGINNFIYYTEYFINLLPLLQKITFAVVLLWIIGLNRVIIIRKQVI